MSCTDSRLDRYCNFITSYMTYFRHFLAVVFGINNRLLWFTTVREWCDYVTYCSTAVQHILAKYE